MALELESFRFVKVGTPKLGESVPSSVIGELTIDLKALGDKIRREWDELREHDVLFMVAINASRMSGAPAPFMEGLTDTTGAPKQLPDEEDITFPQRFGVQFVRGCEVLEVRDEGGNLLNDPIAYQDNQSGEAQGKKRFIKVALDPAQFAWDTHGRHNLGTHLYQTLNLVVRRKAKENNFKAVLETIRDLMKSKTEVNRSIPDWLHDVLLGHGDVSSASYNSARIREYASTTVGVTNPDDALDYGDTFVSIEHLHESYQGYEINMKEDENCETKSRTNFKIATKGNSIEVTPYPFPSTIRGNQVHFTQVQVQAIRSGLSPGLTLVVGPPGSGKTDVAVQIIANIFHSFPTQRTIIVTHSNAALNDLFSKVIARGDIEERYLLRLGSGEKELQSSSAYDFTKAGRVAHTLERRSQLLEEVQRLAETLGVSSSADRGEGGESAYTCETASYFELHHVKRHIKEFMRKVSTSAKSSEDVSAIFPFGAYFSTQKPLSLEEARVLFKELTSIFEELSEYRPLELLRSQRQRTDYLLTNQARIVAMTCTHAAIARAHLVNLGFRYDNIIMEEAGQMLDIETFVPLLLQKSESDDFGGRRLKRVCLIGDHHQLPPVVKNMAFQRYCHLDQSLFGRLIRLGFPAIQLNRQGRSRAEIARLFSWRYENLGNLERVQSLPSYCAANAGFVHTFQFIDVEDFQGRGESSPTAYFYQNLGEAEYAVTLFQYMVLIGYPPEKISLLTTYNGQKELLNDILAQRCGPGTPLAGMRPGAISTVDQYQGQQNDHVILSLVRTTAVGHLRDVRRLIVAVSRARLGLYVLGRKDIFAQCHELQTAMQIFEEKPSKLQLVKGEKHPTERKSNETVPAKNRFEVGDVVVLGGIVHSMQEALC